MRIAIDAMGGDNAPVEIVKGAVEAASLYGVDITLVGDEESIRRAMPRPSQNAGSIDIRHATEVIGMCEPAAAFRTKKDASVVVCADMVRAGEAQAMISAGNTGAAMAVATLKLGRIEGIERPAIATEFPALKSRTILLDAGANADCDVANLIQFAYMGSIYAEKVLSIPNPKVALLNIGEEECKGNDLTKQAYAALSRSSLNFVGNVEGQRLFLGEVNVVVCDGFAGNVALKSIEGLAEYIRQSMNMHPVVKFLLAPALLKLKKQIDYAEYGGAPLLGVNSVCIKGHGRSNARAISNAVKATIRAVDQDVVSAISAALREGAPQSLKVV
jgi:phosphate acyltransferase